MKCGIVFVLFVCVRFTGGDTLNDLFVKRKGASSFLHRDRRGVHHECYAEFCDYEEVREVFPGSSNARRRNEYWSDYKCWRGYQTYCKVDCIYRRSCDLLGWTSWSGNIGTSYSCYSQSRYKRFHYAQERTQQRGNCNGLKTNCPDAPEEGRKVCVCEQALCSKGPWSAWTPSITPGQCFTQSRKQQYSKSVTQKQQTGSCSGISTSCPRDTIETRQQCSCAKAACSLNPWTDWTGTVVQGACAKQERKRTYSFSWSYEIHTSCPADLPKSCPATKLEERVKCSCRYAICNLDPAWSNWERNLTEEGCNQTQTRYRRYRREWAYEEHIAACPSSLSQKCPEDLKETRKQCMCEYRDSCETEPWSPWSDPIKTVGCKTQTRNKQYKHPLKRVQRDNCDGLQTCKTEPVETRTYCKCKQVQCNLQPWTSWSPEPNPDGCVSQRSAQSYQELVKHEFREKTCEGLKTECPADNERNRTMCNCTGLTCSYSEWSEWKGELPEEGCTTQVRTKDVLQSWHHKLKEGNCDGLTLECSLPEEKETRKMCNCRYREDCTLLDWGEWRGDEIKLGSCSTEIRAREFNKSVIVKQQLNNCDSLPKRCSVVEKEESRKRCLCIRQNCNWTEWFKDGEEQNTTCQLFARVRNVTSSTSKVEVFGSCDSVTSNCNSRDKETVRKCGGGQPDGGTKKKIIEPTIITPATPKLPEPMVKKYVPIGCFKDGWTRALPQLIVNLRSEIDWYNMEKTVRGCVQAAAERSYTYVGVQFYGECWSGEDSIQRYNLYGPSSECWNDAGVGKDLTNFVYKIVEVAESICLDKLSYTAEASSGKILNGQWCTNRTEDTNPHLNLTFNSVVQVTALATKGHLEDALQTVYEMDYNEDGRKILPYTENGVRKYFVENSDRFTRELHFLKNRFEAKSIVLRPQSWQTLAICMDVDVYGCSPDKA